MTTTRTPRKRRQPNDGYAVVKIAGVWIAMQAVTDERGLLADVIPCHDERNNLIIRYSRRDALELIQHAALSTEIQLLRQKLAEVMRDNTPENTRNTA